MNIITLLTAMAQTAPDQTALIHGHTHITYRALEERSRAVGAFLQAQGVQPGQRALLLIPLGIEFYVILLGLARIGVTVMLIDPAVGKAQMTACCQLAQPDLLIGAPQAHLLRLTHAAIRRIPRKFSLRWALPGSTALREQSATVPCRDAVTTATDPALITFTSGSTGLPKGICRTHGFLLHQHAVLCETIPAAAGAIELNTLPVFILSSLARGITVVIPQRFGRATAQTAGAQILREITENRVNRLLAAPAFCQQLTDHLARTEQTLTTVQQIYTGGGPVFPNLLDALAQRLPQATVVAVYGSTEAEPIAQINRATLLPADWQAMQHGKGLLVGQPVAAIRVAILPDTVGQPLGPLTAAAFAAAQLPPNRVGEIVVTGDHVQKGYLGGDDGLTKVQVGATIWHRTGDAGYLDGAGRLWLLGRCTARVGQGSSVCYPLAIEAAAMSYAGVARAAFVEVAGEGVLAVQTERAQWPALRQQLAPALPTVAQLQWVAQIPVDTRHGSKVLYAEVRRLLRG
jgi:acyl-CoA synthetase (AMP-forming)/AMP-acid ligase II